MAVKKKKTTKKTKTSVKKKVKKKVAKTSATKKKVTKKKVTKKVTKKKVTKKKTVAKKTVKKKAVSVPKAPTKKSTAVDHNELARQILGESVFDKMPVKKTAAKRPGMEFIGTFPMRSQKDDKKNDFKKIPTGPHFDPRQIKIGAHDSELGQVLLNNFKKTYANKFSKDELVSDTTEASSQSTLLQALSEGRLDVVVCSMDNLGVNLDDNLLVCSSTERGDPRDVMVTRVPYGAVQELPREAKVGCSQKRHSLQVKNLRPDLEVVALEGGPSEKLRALEDLDLDAVLLSWADLKRLNISPRFYATLQTEHLLPSPGQGIVGILCRQGDEDIANRLKLIDDSEASWASRCERAFLTKLSKEKSLAVGAFAHRKGTQDPWILDAVIGDEKTGELLRYREIGTSRCKPESLADKAYMGVVARGGRKYIQ